MGNSFPMGNNLPMPDLMTTSPENDRNSGNRLVGNQEAHQAVNATIAQIFNGEITTLNDPAIAAENEGVELPEQDITVIFRSDESGTTDNFQKYVDVSSA